MFDSIGLYPEQCAHVLSCFLATSEVTHLQFSESNIVDLSFGVLRQTICKVFRSNIARYCPCRLGCDFATQSANSWLGLYPRRLGLRSRDLGWCIRLHPCRLGLHPHGLGCAISQTWARAPCRAAQSGDLRSAVGCTVQQIIGGQAL